MKKTILAAMMAAFGANLALADEMTGLVTRGRLPFSEAVAGNLKDGASIRLSARKIGAVPVAKMTAGLAKAQAIEVPTPPSPKAEEAPVPFKKKAASMVLVVGHAVKSTVKSGASAIRDKLTLLGVTSLFGALAGATAMGAFATSTAGSAAVLAGAAVGALCPPLALAAGAAAYYGGKAAYRGYQNLKARLEKAAA